MKRNMCLMILVAAMVLARAHQVRATDAYNHPGPYVGLGAAGGLSDFGGALRGTGDSVGFNFRAGYRFNDYIAIEGLYEYMDEFGKTVRGPLDTKATTHLTTNGFSLMDKLLLPIPGMTQLQPYLSGGIGFLNVDGTQTFTSPGLRVKSDTSRIGFAGRVDGGIDYFVTPTLSTFLDAGYVIPTDEVDNLHYISVSAGLRYNF
jgi:Outer membrane protein beta-barrel domain